MIEVFGKDGKVFRFQDGTSDEVIQAALDNHYQAQTPEITSDPATRSPPGVNSPTREAIAPPNARAPVSPAPIVAPPPYAPFQAASQDSYVRNYEAERPENKAMKATMMAGAAALGVLAVVAVLWSTGMMGKQSEPANPAATQSASTRFQATPQPDMRQALVATQIRKESKSDSAVLREMVAGATFDVLGEQTMAGTQWARVRVDQTSGDIGYVPASHLGAIGSRAPGVDVVASTGTATNGAGAVTIATDSMVTTPPPPGRIPNVVAPPRSSAANMAATTYYVVSERLNLRASASPNAARVGQMTFGTRVVADAQSNFQGRIWLRVRAGGVTGWVNSDLVSQSPAGAPIDAPQYAEPPPGRYVNSAPTEATPTYRDSDEIRVIAINANVRAEPSARSGVNTVVDVAPQGDILSVSRVVRRDGSTWYLVTTSKGIRGWISDDTVTPVY
jgi:uncharacterized protein YgiM (DUF1202 family)